MLQVMSDRSFSLHQGPISMLQVMSHRSRGKILHPHMEAYSGRLRVWGLGKIADLVLVCFQGWCMQSRCAPLWFWSTISMRKGPRSTHSSISSRLVTSIMLPSKLSTMNLLFVSCRDSTCCQARRKPQTLNTILCACSGARLAYQDLIQQQRVCPGAI
jgi:hypothetical protein